MPPRRAQPLSELVLLLNVENVDESIAFYATVLGASVEDQWKLEGRTRWARIAFDGGRLMLNTPDRVDSTGRRGRAEFADAVLYLMCEDASARREVLAEAGLAVSALSREDYGNDEFSVRDPDGYVIRFSSPRR